MRRHTTRPDTLSYLSRDPIAQVGHGALDHAMQLERRFTTSPVTLVDSAGSAAGAGRTVRGYAAVFNTRSAVLADQSGAFVETIARGAFDGVLGDNVLALLNHDSNFVLARSKGGKGTLSIGVDATGLWYRFVAPETTAGNDLVVSLKRGDISESSFAFSVAKGGDSWKRDAEGVRIRMINKVGQLYDVSAVANPAYAATSVSVRHGEYPSPSSATQPALSGTDYLWKLRAGSSKPVPAEAARSMIFKPVPSGNRIWL